LAAELLQETLTAALAVLQELEGAWRRSFESRLSSVVSEGLTAIFGEEIKLEVKSTVKRDATSMQLVLTQGGIEIDDIVGGTGGSLVSVLDVLLKILLLVSAPDLRRVLVLDESFRMVEARHLPALGQLLRELSQRLDLQFILVSHETELLDAADVVYEVANGGVKLIKDRMEERE
jgi:ABC-type sugar transport system ATPase subunit